MEIETKEWIGHAAWIYPDKEDEFISFLIEEAKKDFPHIHIYKSEYLVEKKEQYPQYLCSADLGVGGDIVHLWRDGQTWWPICGDYTLEDEEKIELVLRKSMIAWLEEKRKEKHSI